MLLPNDYLICLFLSWCKQILQWSTATSLKGGAWNEATNWAYNRLCEALLNRRTSTKDAVRKGSDWQGSPPPTSEDPSKHMALYVDNNHQNLTKQGTSSLPWAFQQGMRRLELSDNAGECWGVVRPTDFSGTSKAGLLFSDWKYPRTCRMKP